MKLELSNELNVKLRYHLTKALKLPLDSVSSSQGNILDWIRVKTKF